METLLLLGGLAGLIQMIVIIILITKFFQLTTDIHEIKIFLFKAYEQKGIISNFQNNESSMPQTRTTKYVVDLKKEKDGSGYTGKFSKNEHVIRKADGFEMEISSIKNGLYKCFSGDGKMLYQGEYEENELLRK